MYKHSILFKISNPFHQAGDFFSSLLKLSVSSNSFTSNKRKYPHWKIELQIGPGAGYRCGHTIYLSHGLGYNSAIRYPSSNTHLWEHLSLGEGRRAWQMGLTQDVNLIPYVDGW